MNDDYQVGFGKPPQATKFKKGVSGNPAGRPKKDNSFFGNLHEELSEDVGISLNGKRSKVTSLQGLLKVLNHRARNGDYKYLSLLLRYASQSDQHREALAPKKKVLPEHLKEILEGYVQRRFREAEALKRLCSLRNEWPRRRLRRRLMEVGHE